MFNSGSRHIEEATDQSMFSLFSLSLSSKKKTHNYFKKTKKIYSKFRHP